MFMNSVTGLFCDIAQGFKAGLLCDAAQDFMTGLLCDTAQAWKETEWDIVPTTHSAVPVCCEVTLAAASFCGDS